MTDRHAAYLIVLGEDIREDDAEFVLNAMTMIKGVASVLPVPADIDQAIARERRDSSWRQALRKLAQEGPPE